MPNIMPTSNNYSGRTVDIELLQSIQKPVNVQRVNVAVVTQVPKMVTGIEKLVQRYALTFLSSVNTVHFDQEFGTTMLSDMVGGMIGSKGQLDSLFAIANADAVRIIIESDQLDTEGTFPDDEKLQSAELLDSNIDYSNATAYIKVLITSVAGDSITFIIPTTAPR